MTHSATLCGGCSRIRTSSRRRSLKAALEALDLARWDDLPEATLPWERVAELADRQGIGEADVVWDLTAGPRAA